MARPQLLSLQRPLNRFVRQCRTNLLRTVSMDDVNSRRLELLRGRQRIGNQRPARQWLQHLWQIGLHALALTGSEDDDGKRGHWEGSSY